MLPFFFWVQTSEWKSSAEIAGPLAVTLPNDHLLTILDARCLGRLEVLRLRRSCSETITLAAISYLFHVSLDGVSPENEDDVPNGLNLSLLPGSATLSLRPWPYYNEFKCSSLKLSQAKIDSTGEVNVSFDLQTGLRAGTEVAKIMFIKGSRK
jgi:hypothetical protein